MINWCIHVNVDVVIDRIYIYHDYEVWCRGNSVRMHKGVFAYGSNFLIHDCAWGLGNVYASSHIFKAMILWCCLCTIQLKPILIG